MIIPELFNKMVGYMNKKIEKIFISLLFILTILSTMSFAEQIKLTSCNWKPYNAEGLLNYGFASEIISTAFARRGYKVSFTFLPWKRAMKETERGLYHGLFAAYYNRERAEIYQASDPYITGPLVLCAKKNSKIKYKNLIDLKSYKIGTVMGYANTEEFDNANYLQKDPVISDIQNIRKLLAGRVDLIVVDKYLALYHLKNTPVLSGNTDSVKFLEPPLQEKNLHIMFSRAIPGFEKRVKDFNLGLKEIKDDGTYKEILIKHDFY